MTQLRLDVVDGRAGLELNSAGAIVLSNFPQRSEGLAGIGSKVSEKPDGVSENKYWTTLTTCS